MAHSIQVVGEAFVIFRDGDLMDLIALLREELERASGGYGRARPIVAAWREQLRRYTPGCIMLETSEIAASPENCADTLSLLAALRRRLGGMTAIPQATMAALCDVESTVYLRDVDASSVVETIDKLSALLEGR